MIKKKKRKKNPSSLKNSELLISTFLKLQRIFPAVVFLGQIINEIKTLDREWGGGGVVANDFGGLDTHDSNGVLFMNPKFRTSGSTSSLQV